MVAFACGEKEANADAVLQGQIQQEQDMVNETYAQDDNTDTEVQIPVINDLPSKITAIGLLVMAAVLLILVIAGSLVMGIGEFLQASKNIPFTLIGSLASGFWIVSGVLTLLTSRLGPKGMFRGSIISWIIQTLGNILLFSYGTALTFGLVSEYPYRVYWTAGGVQELYSVIQLLLVVLAVCILQFVMTVLTAVGMTPIFVAKRRLAMVM